MPLVLYTQHETGRTKRKDTRDGIMKVTEEMQAVFFKYEALGYS